MIKLIKQSALKITLFFIALLGSISVAQAAKLAIVIDDIGYRHKQDNAIYALPTEISVAIIPDAPNAKQRNQQAKKQGRDILIHQPMQAKSGMKLEAGALYLGMSQAEVDSRIKQAKSIVSYAIGLNNHTGSAATADTSLMQKLMLTLQQQHLFFLDSRTIGNSVASKIAKQQGIPTLERHIFLDNSDKLSDVQHQFQQAIAYARKHGTAIVIGHPRPNTIAVLQSGLANLPADIQLVKISSLWRNEKVIPAKPFILLFNDKPAPTSVPPFEPIIGLRGVPQ